jgi:putative AdoMet-dependent methyltransferase
VIGLDPSEKMLERAHHKIGDNPDVTLQQAAQPFLEIRFADDHFDAVVSTYGFHHVPPPWKSKGVEEMIRVLKPGRPWVLGDLIFETEEAERAALKRYEWLEEEYFARIDELQPVFGNLGLELHSQQFTPVTWVLWTVKKRG